MNQRRSRPRQRFDRGEDQRRLYIEQQNAGNNRRRYDSPQRYLNPDSPIGARKIRSASNPDITGFYRQGEDNNLLSQYLQHEPDFETEGLSEQEFNQFEENEERKRSYVLAKRGVTRQKNGYHEPLKGKRSHSLGEIDRILIKDPSRIYEPVEQLYSYARRDDPRNSLGNASRDSGKGNSRPGSPSLQRPSHYDHIFPRLPKDYDPNRRSSQPINPYQPYEQHYPRRVPSPVNVPMRQRSRSIDNNLSNTNSDSQYSRKTSSAGPYEVLGRKPRSITDDSDTRNGNHNRGDDYIRVPGPGYENWIMRRKSLSMDRTEGLRQSDRSNLTPPTRRPPRVSPPRSPRPNRIPPRPPVPTPRRASRENLNDEEANMGMIPKSPNHGKQNSMDSKKSENIYDNPRDILSGLPYNINQPETQESSPPEGKVRLPERRRSNDVSDGLPYNMIQPMTQESSPPEGKVRLPERRRSNDVLDSLPSDMIRPMTQQSSPPEGEVRLPERRRSNDVLDSLPSDMIRPMTQQSSPPEGEVRLPERRRSTDVLDGLPYNMIHPETQQSSPPEAKIILPERRNSIDPLDGLPSIMVHPGTRPPSPNEKETMPERRSSTDQHFQDPFTNEIRDMPYDDNVRRPSSNGGSPNEPPFKNSPTFPNGSLPMDFNEGTYAGLGSPSIADTSLSRDSYYTNNSNYKLTVEGTPNTESEPIEEEEFCTNVYVITTKWAAVILTCLVVLFCVTANKICLLVIGHEYSHLKDNATLSKAQKADGKDRWKYSSKESIVIMLVIIIMIPQAISLFYGVWGKRKSQKWPKKSAILWIIFGGTIEASCISFLCIYVLTVLSIEPSFFLLFISGLFVIPTIIQISQSAKRWETKKGKMRIVTFTIAAGMQIAGLILLVYSKEKMIELRAKIEIPITIAFLSIAWSPKIRKLQTKPANPVAVADHQASMENVEFIDDAEAISVTPKDSPPPPKKQAAREKAAIVMSLVQLIMTPLASLIFCQILGIAELEKVGEGFNLITSNHPAFYFFLTQIFVTFLGYHMAWLACSMYAQRPAFALPLTLATPLALVLIEVRGSCENYSFIPLKCGPQEGDQLYYMIAVAILMLTGQFLSTGYYVWANMGYIMGKASHLFWLPSYTGVLLEPFLLLNRRNKVTDDKHVASKRLARDSYVFICTTMYHEVKQEMVQLLSSIHDIDLNFEAAGRHVESHVFFDGCIKAEVMNNYILQLATVIESTLKVKLADVTKVLTPYGMQLRWKLPGGLPITIHLKDNTKVKNKKRWSQVMYMSYILDYKQRIFNVPDDQTFILTTDADVKFTHESMEALIDYMVQDEQIGAVCGRTHPLGNGPMVWYQIFDYAIGHWFMKVANHVFGSVLCCPGCFSLYRCQAVRAILPTYSTTVSEAFEFLTKDMGEDRWMCTLMVQAGWRLAYCAAAEDETYCPMEFEEFYKQRRRWMPSTLANLTLLVSEWRTVLKNNESISFPFIVYQVVLLCATLIGPSIVILFIVGGLVNMGMNEIAAAVILSSVTIGYAVICFFFPQSTQITVAKFLTFIFAVIMIIVTIGLSLQIRKELIERQQLRASNSTDDIPFHKQLPAGISTLYLAGLSAIFVIAAFMHPREALCLLNGIWYLLCLPSGYLLLTVYSVVNMTDRSWGTREGKTKGGKEANPLNVLWDKFKSSCACCFRPCANKEEKPPEPEQKSTESTKDKIKRKLSRRSRFGKSTKSTGSKKGPRSRINSKEFDSEVDSESASESLRSKNRLRTKGSLGKLHEVLRQSLKGIGFIRNDDPSLDQQQMQENYPMQHGSMPGKPTIMVTTVPGNGPIDYQEENDSFQFSEMFGTIQKMQQGSSDEGYSSNNYHSNQAGFPPLPVNPLQRPLNGRENQGYNHEIMEDYPNAPGYPVVVPNETPEDFDRPRRNGTYPIYDEINPYPVPRNPSFDRVKASDQFFKAENDSAYGGSSSSGGQPIRPRRPSHVDMIEHAHDPHFLNVKNYDSISTIGGSLGGISSFALLTSDDIYLPVEEWLKGDLREYVPNFRNHGYDSIAFISNMKEKDLESIGIKKRGHRQKIAREITKLPKHEIDEDIPNDVGEWLEDLGLEEYIEAFDENGYNEPSDLEDLKNMDKDLVKETFKVDKTGHLDMLYLAINKLQYANQGQKDIRMARRELIRVPTHMLECYNNDGGDEYDFWFNLREACLTPELKGFDGNTELKEKLEELRNSSVMVFLVSNALWMIIILVLVKQEGLKTLGVDLIGLSFLIVYGTIIILQFLAMIGHRLTTLLHVLARAPWICCRPRKTTTAEAQGPQR